MSELSLTRLVDGPLPKLFGAQPEGASPIASAYADDRGISRIRPQTTVHSLAIGDPAYGELAIGAARTTGGGMHTVPEAEVLRLTRLLAETTGVFADCAGGVALGALIDAVSSGAISRDSQVVLVVTGAGVKPHGHDQRPQATEVDANVDALLHHLRL